MSVENTATVDTNTESNAAAPASNAGADGASGADDLLGDVSNAGADAGAETQADKGEQGDDAAKAKDDGDDLLEGKVAEEAPAADAEDYDLTPPEGYELDADLAQSFKPVAKELKLSKEQAQGLVEKFGPQLMSQIGEKQAAAWAAVRQKWANEAKADPEFGGANLEKSLADVARARDFLGTDFTAAIKLLGGNNHPAILKALAKVGVALGEDTPGFGKPASAQTTVEQRLYPNDQPKNRE